VAICEFYELDCGRGEGAIGVWVWFGAPITHRMSGLSLAWQLQGRCGHAHLRSQSGIVWSGGWLLILPELVSVKKRVFFICLECLE
jgi:hypothetical protein